MTMLITTTTRYGLVMAADSRRSYGGKRRPEDNQRKIVPWNDMNAAVGFAGLIDLRRGQKTDQLIEELMNSDRWTSLGAFAIALADRLRSEIPSSLKPAQKMVYVHVAGFGTDGNPPEFHYVRNMAWERQLDYFQVNEDLRFTYLRALGVTSAGKLRKHPVRRLQFSGTREPFATLIKGRLPRALKHFKDLRDVALWTRRQVKEVSGLPSTRSVVGGEPQVWMITAERGVAKLDVGP